MPHQVLHELRDLLSTMETWNDACSLEKRSFFFLVVSCILKSTSVVCENAAVQFFCEAELLL